MAYAGKLMLMIVPGGILLGSALGTFADPVMKAAPGSPWGEHVASAISGGSSSPYIEPLPENLNPPAADGYAPAAAFTELPEPWQADFPAPQFADGENYASWPDGLGQAPEDEAAPLMASGTRTEFVQVAEVATAAEAAAQDAVSAAPPLHDAVNEEPQLSPLY